MKYRFTQLSIGQKVLVLIQAGMLLLFLILYLTVGRMQYIDFRGDHLRFTTEEQTRIYSGQVDHKDVSITVSPDRSIRFRLDGTEYGPYTIVENPTAVPDGGDGDLLLMDAALLTGIEVRDGNKEVYFRGGYYAPDSDMNVFFLYDESGYLVSTYTFGLSATAEPQPEEILDIVLDPDPAPRGHAYGFLLGALFNLATVLMILYADEMFRYSLRFRIENAEDAEPSEWELFSRWIGWFAFTGCALVLYIMGLNNF